MFCFCKPYCLRTIENLPNNCTDFLFLALAAQCLTNLRTTFRYGGRKNVPSKVEIEAMTVSTATIQLFAKQDDLGIQHQ